MPIPRRYLIRMILLAAGFLLFFVSGGYASQGSPARAVLIPVGGVIDSGMENYINHALGRAEEKGAAAVILELDTPGGYLGAAYNITKLLDDFPGPVYAFVRSHALSAGAYLALAANEIYMVPGSTLGAAEPRLLGGGEVDEKTLSSWEAEMRAAAQRRGRDPQVAAAMVRKDIAIEGVVDKGILLTLTDEEALALGYSEGTVENRGALLDRLGFSRSGMILYSPRLVDRLVGWTTQPVVATLLLIAGITCLVVELFTPGFGVFGLTSILAFTLYFGGHYAAGLARYWVLLLFGLGVVLLLIEVVIPGFGIIGITGILSIIASIVLAAETIEAGLLMVAAALVLSALFAFLAYRFFERRGTLRRIFLADEARSELGYVSTADHRDLCGLEGVTLTALRPAGAAQIGNRRVDVISEGAFIPAGAPVQVVLVEGARVVVRPSDTGSKTDHQDS